MNPLFPRLFCAARVSFSVGGTVFSGRSETRATSPFTARGGDGLEAARATRRPRREHVMSGAKLRTEKAVNSVMADQTIETELAQLVSEYLQHHRCERAYEVRPFGTRAFPERRQSSVRARPALARPVSLEDAQSE